jgi:hypothetical protein
MENNALKIVVGELVDQLHAQAIRNTALFNALSDEFLIPKRRLSKYVKQAEAVDAQIWLDLRNRLINQF